MFFEYLRPLDADFVKEIEGFPEACLGKKIVLHTNDAFPDLTKVKLAILGVLDNRGDLMNYDDAPKLDSFRSNFYRFYPGNWEFSIADLGDLPQGETQEDTYFALSSIVSDLVKSRIVPIIIGGSQDLTYSIYRAFDGLEQMVNLVSIDSKFDIGKQDDLHNNESYLSKIITNAPHNLYNFSNIGYQTFFNSQEEIDLLEKMHFDVYRLGEIVNDIAIAEPILRDADIVSLDVNAIKSSVTGNVKKFQPNGFDGVEVCKLARYAGISDKVSVFGIFNLCHEPNESVILSEIIWYFIEGYHQRSNEYPFVSKSQYTKYHVLVDDIEILFYKSKKTGRWWMDTSNDKGLNNNLNNSSLLSCTEDDYLKACDQEIPERWWRSAKKQIM
ncbi:MAG: formimidoylglutamase [Flavobacterium sp.]